MKYSFNGYCNITDAKKSAPSLDIELIKEWVQFPFFCNLHNYVYFANYPIVYVFYENGVRFRVF